MRADYSLRLKIEMLSAGLQLKCCRQSFLAGLLGGSKIAPFVKTRSGLKKKISKILKRTIGKSHKLCFADRRIVIPGFPLLELRRKYVERMQLVMQGADNARHCQIAFMQALFISCGYMQNPGRGYHLEFRVRGRWLKAAFKKTARFLKIRFSTLCKEDYLVFYSKSSRRIIRILNLLGVFEKALEMSDFIATRKILSMVNRQVNSETANINRLVSAAEKTIVQINQLLELPDQSFWTENLYEAALMRLKFPHDGIEKLGQRFEPPLTKSAVNHRLRRINATFDRFFKKVETGEKED